MKVDTQDYVRNPERTHPGEIPNDVYVVYYQGTDGEDVWTLPTFYMTNAKLHAAALSCPTKILTYTLTDSVDVERKTFAKRMRMKK